MNTTTLSRRALLTGTAAATLSASGASLANTTSTSEAARLARKWAELMNAEETAYLATEDATDRAHADPDYPEIGKCPQPPRPEYFASAEARAEDDVLVSAARDLGRRCHEASERCRKDGEGSPAYLEAMKAHREALAEWEATIARKRDIEARHGVERTEAEHLPVIEARDAATQALIEAPITSAEDALAVLAAAVFWSDVTEPTVTMTDDLRRRIAPWPPAVPKAWT